MNKINFLYAAVLSKNQPEKAVPTTALASIVRPAIDICMGSRPIGLNKLLIMFPRLKNNPMNIAKEIVSSNKLLFYHMAFRPSSKLMFSSLTVAEAEGGFSGLSRKVDWKNMKPNTFRPT